MRLRARSVLLILAIALAAGAVGCKALPKPHLPSLGGSVISSSATR